MEEIGMSFSFEKILVLKSFELRILFALFLGTCIGIERRIRNASAGLITYSLVAVGASLYVIVGNYLADASEEHADIMKFAGQIITGIGFLGGGVILKNDKHIRGLNTAATIWCSGAVGIIAGLGLVYEGLVAMIFVVLGNSITRFADKPVADDQPDND